MGDPDLMRDADDSKDKDDSDRHPITRHLLKARSILLFGPIEPKSTQKIITQLLVLNQMERQGAHPRCYMNSPGGWADDGLRDLRCHALRRGPGLHHLQRHRGQRRHDRDGRRREGPSLHPPALPPHAPPAQQRRTRQRKRHRRHGQGDPAAAREGQRALRPGDRPPGREDPRGPASRLLDDRGGGRQLRPGRQDPEQREGHREEASSSGRTSGFRPSGRACPASAIDDALQAREIRGGEVLPPLQARPQRGEGGEVLDEGHDVRVIEGAPVDHALAARPRLAPAPAEEGQQDREIGVAPSRDGL